MQSLSDFIRKKQREPKNEMTLAKSLSKEEAEWTKAKALVEGLSNDFNKVIAEITNNNPNDIKITERREITTIIAKIPNMPFETTLEILEHKWQKVFNVTYYCFNHKSNTVFMREIYRQKLEK